MAGRAWFVVTFLMLGCGTEAPVPDDPKWATDVLPILQANCFHCHGAQAPAVQAKSKEPINRWDILDLTDPNWATLGFMEMTNDANGVKFFVSANNTLHFTSGVLSFIKPDLPEEGRMPPWPATRLPARDIEVLTKWADKGFKPGSHSPNHKPAISWITKNKVLAVTDEDGDQVMGKLDCGGTEVVLNRSGSHTLPSGVTGPCSAMIYDGWGEITSAELK